MPPIRSLAARLSLSLALGGCAAWPPASPLPLLPPSALGASHLAAQTVHAAIGDRDLTLRCIVQAEPEQLRVIVLDPMGRRLMSASWDGVRIDADAGAQSSPIPPAQLLADVQLALWPLAAWQAALPAGAVHVDEPRPGLRRLVQGRRLLAEVHYASADPWQGRAWLVNFAAGYSLDIVSEPL